MTVSACLWAPVVMRLTGASDWTTPTIKVYIDVDSTGSDECVRARHKAVKDAVAQHVLALVSHVFLGQKPARPSQSRWTGVAAVARWCLSLALFHKMLGPLFQALAAGDKGASAAVCNVSDLFRGSGASDGNISLDGDAWASLHRVLCFCVACQGADVGR